MENYIREKICKNLERERGQEGKWSSFENMEMILSFGLFVPFKKQVVKTAAASLLGASSSITHEKTRTFLSAVFN